MGSAAGCGGMTALLEAIVLSSNMKNCDRKKDLISLSKLIKMFFFHSGAREFATSWYLPIQGCGSAFTFCGSGSSCFFYADSDPAKKIVKISYELSVVEKNNNKTG